MIQANVMHREYDPIGKISRLEKLKELDIYFDEQLKLQRKSSLNRRKRVRFSSSVKKGLVKLSGLALLIVLPFFVLVRTSVYLYSTYQLNGWLALTGGMTATVLLLLVYMVFISRRIVNKRVMNKHQVQVTLLVVLVYCCYGLLYLSGMNAKNQEVRSYYHTLHPILRITLATTTLADQQLIITDTRRIPDDYYAMGLPVNKQSLHYVQKSGYVHAVDVRTKGRAEWKNRLAQSLFRLAGLEISRHVGTADHLHVFLPLNN